MADSSNGAKGEFPDVSHLPEPFRKDFKRLSYQATRVHGRWQRFLHLFGEGELRIELLNETAPTFFKDLQETYIDTIFLSITRLLDPLKSAGDENLVLEQLIERAKEVGDHDLADDLSDQLDDLKNHCSNLKTWRHKRLAHLDRDFEHKRIVDQNPLPDIQRKTVDEALSFIQDYLNTVEGYYGGGEIHFEPITKGDAESLIVALKKAVDHDDAVVDGDLSYKRFHRSRFHDA